MVASIAQAGFGAVDRYAQGADQLAASRYRLISNNRFFPPVDGAVSVSVANGVRSDITAARAGLKASGENIALLDRAAQGLTEISILLERQRALAEVAADTGTTPLARAELNAQFQDLSNRINRVVETTQFKGKALLDGSLEGNDAPQVSVGNGVVAFEIADSSSAALFDGSTPDLTTVSAAEDTVEAVDEALARLAERQGAVDGGRSQFRSELNRQASALGGLETARSSVTDTDQLREALAFALAAVQQQASVAVVAQAGLLKGDLLGLLAPAISVGSSETQLVLPDSKKPSQAASNTTDSNA